MRKIVRAQRLVALLNEVVTISAVLAVLGIALYFSVFESDVVLMEAFVWLVEAISFLGLAVAFNIAASRVASRERMEVLRLESLAALLLSIAAVGLTLAVMSKTLLGAHTEPTPLPLSLYPFASAVVSYALEAKLNKAFKKYKVKLVSAETVARKLGLDVLLEAAGGLSIVLSNALRNVWAEKLLVLGVGCYVLYGLGSLAFESAQYLLGIGPRRVVELTRRSVRRVVVKRLGRPPLHMKVETYGTFSEVEVWIEAKPYVTLEEAYRASMMLARDIVREVPEVVRALVIMVPVRRREAAPVARGRVLRAGVQALERRAESVALAPRGPKPLELSKEVSRGIGRRVPKVGAGVGRTLKAGTGQPSQPQRAEGTSDQMSTTN